MGIEPRRVNYIAFSGGGESMSAILGGTVSVGINGFAEFAPQLEAGTLRALAISSAERLPGVDIPTLREQGVDVEFENWRSLVAPPGISPADRARLETTLRAMVHSATWRESLARYRWLDRYLDGDAFARFVDAEEARVRAILKKLGTGATRDELEHSVWRVSTDGARSASRSSAWRRCDVDDGASAKARASSQSAPSPAIGSPTVQSRWSSSASASCCTCCWPSAPDSSLPRPCCSGARRAPSTIVIPLRDGIAALAISLGSYVLFARVLQLSLPAGISPAGSDAAAGDPRTAARGFRERADVAAPGMGAWPASRWARPSACCPASGRR